MEKIRILEVVDNYYPIIDGVVNVVDNYATLLNRYDDVECDVLVPWYPNSHNGSGGYKVIRTLSMSGGKYGVRLPLPMFDLRLKKYLKENHYDIVHCHSPVTLSRTMLRYCKKNNIPIVFTVHTKYHEEINRSVGLKCLQKFALNFLLSSIKKMDYVWSVSNGSKDCLTDIYKVNVPCEVMRNGSDVKIEEKEKATASSKLIDTKYGIKEDEKVFLFVGRLVVVKNISMILKTIRILTDRGEKCKLIIVGDGDYKKELEKEVKALNIEDKVVFTGRITDKTELCSFYIRADLFLFASTFDNCSLALIEAAAVNLPSLLVEGSSSAEQIIDGHNGYVSNLDANSWADKIQDIFSDTDNYNKVSENCNKELFVTWDTIIEQVLIKYKEIIKAGKPKK